MLYDIEFEATSWPWLPPKVDGHTHHHIHSPDHLECRGDYSEGWDVIKHHYEGRTDVAIIVLPHCIYPCWMVRQNRIDHNIAELSAYP